MARKNTRRAEPARNPFARKVRALRILNGLSQHDLAERIGVRSGAVSCWERGDRLPDLHRLADLARALDFSESRLAVLVSESVPDVVARREDRKKSEAA
jgi:transcriptional regulator with XRE-family HTH domain